MPGRIARKLCPCRPVSGTGFRIGLAVAVLFFGSETLQNAVANGDTRTLALHNIHTKDNLTVTFKRDGRYDQAELKKLNWFLRDWRRNEATRIDPQLLDLLWEVYREVDANQPIHVICGYRAPQTNMMLRRRSNGVARNSQHTLGKAIDFAIPGVPLEKLRIAGLRMQRGGVGFYPGAGGQFVHLDIGGVRHWPRMTRQQLVKVFPNGRTVHIPSDGQPLSGYALALADVQRQGASPSQLSLATAQNSGIIEDSNDASVSGPANLLARIFGPSHQDDEDASATSATPDTPLRVAAAGSATQATPPAAQPTVPLPKLRPATAPTVVAAAFPARDTEPTDAKPAPRAVAVYTVASAVPTAKVSLTARPKLTPSQIIEFRGYWAGPTAPMFAATTDAAPQTTASIPPQLTIAKANANAAPDMAMLAYAGASAHDARRVPYEPPRRSLIIQSSAAATSIAVKADDAPAVRSGSMTVTPKPPPFNPWIAAVAMTPSVRYFLSATQYGTRDFRSLRPYLEKPDVAVAMTFSHDPNLGLSAERFDGRAVVFVGTVVFASGPAPTRTAGLR